MATKQNTGASHSGLTDTNREKLLAAVVEQIAYYSGRGSNQYVFETVLTKHDRFGTAAVQLNSEMVGLTFFTKPRLNMSTTSLRQDPQLAMMDTLDPTSLMFSIRCNLDTVFANQGAGHNAASNSPWVNQTSPFNIPLGNLLVGISGFPDFNIEYETTEAGYFTEAMSLVRGSDRGRRNYDLSCTFRDIQGGYIMAYLYYWLHAMALQMEGAIVAYPDDRAANRLNYTCSIYRFILDPSMRTIVKWAKATGCYPVSVPLGDVFNFSPGDSFVHTSQQFTVPFRATNITYMDPRHLAAFNTLVQRYAGPTIAGAGKDLADKLPSSTSAISPTKKSGATKSSGGWTKAPATAQSNFMGVPYIDQYNGTNELMWLAKTNEIVDPSESVINDLIASLSSSTDSDLLPHYTSDMSKT